MQEFKGENFVKEFTIPEKSMSLVWQNIVEQRQYNGILPFQISVANTLQRGHVKYYVDIRE